MSFFIAVMVLLSVLLVLLEAEAEEQNNESPFFNCATPPEMMEEWQEALFYDLLWEQLEVSSYALMNSSFRTPSTGEARILVLPIMFTDSEFQDGAQSWDETYELLNKAFFGEDDGGHLTDQSLRTMYARLSYGRLNVTGDVLPIYFAEGTYADHLPYEVASGKLDEAYKLVTDALATYDIDYSKYDADGEGSVDCLFVVRGVGGSNSGGISIAQMHPQIEVKSDTTIIENVVWTHDYGDYAKTAVHEMAHCMGLLDNYQRSDPDSQGHNCVIDAILDEIMGGGSGNLFNAYYSYLLGWTEPVILTSDSPVQEVVLSAVEDFDTGPGKGAKSVVYIPEPTGLPFTEFYIAEYRNCSEAPLNLFGETRYKEKPGVILWHCNTETLYGRGGVFAHPTDYLKAVCPTGSESFTPADYLVPQGAPWNEYSTSTIISPDTTPVNTDFYNGTKTGLFLQVLGQDKDCAVLRIGTVEAGKIQQEALEITSEKTVTYGDAPFRITTAGGSGAGVVTYKAILGDALSVTPEGMATIQRAGTTIVTATKAGDDVYTDTVTNLLITVNPRDIAKVSVTELPAVAYNGKSHSPVPTVTDAGAVITSNDYEVTYGENINAPEGTVILTGKGNYTGSLQVTFPIERAVKTIKTAQELRDLAATVNVGEDCVNLHFKLMADIDLGGEAEPFTSIGDYSNHFQGILDGNGYQITDLYVNTVKPSGPNSYQGLIGVLGEDGIVQNLKVEGVVRGGTQTGGIVGRNYGIVENCSYIGNVTDEYNYAGGLVGENLTTGVVRNCYSISDLWGGREGIGGIAGSNTGVIEDCYHTGVILGGQVGFEYQRDSRDYVGGIVGRNSCTDDHIGTVRNCYHWGDVTGEGRYVGGVIGTQNYIDWQGVERPGTSENCYYILDAADGGIDSVDVAGVAEGKTAEEFQTESTFVNWDFDTVWIMSEAHGRPILRAIPEMSHIHDYATGWSSDDVSHWHECECGDKTDFAEHTAEIDPREEATCTQPGKTEGSHCPVCERVLQAQTVIQPLGHSYSVTWSQDETNHWHECSRCQEKKDLAPHAEDTGTVTKQPTEEETGIRTFSCVECSRVMRTETIPKLEPSHTHEYSEDWKSDGTSHWHECECGDRADMIAHTPETVSGIEATCTQPGKTEGSRCSICGRILTAQTEIPVKGHTLGTDWGSDATGHWHECTVCHEKADQAPHTWDGGTVTTAPTSTKAGVRTYTCTLCKQTRTETIPATGGGSSSGGSSGGSYSSGGSTATRDPEYTVTLPQKTEGGSIKAEPQKAVKGSKVTLTVESTEGYELEEITVKDKKGNELTLEKMAGKYVFSMPGSNVEVTAAFRKVPVEEIPPSPPPKKEEPQPRKPELPFTDVPEKAWYYDAVAEVYDRDIMTGLSETRFAPELPASRGMVVTMLYRMEGEPPIRGKTAFTDISGKEYYAQAVAWATVQGLVNGYGDGTFRPNEEISREQLVTILYRYAERKGYDMTRRADLSGFFDVGQISPYAREAMSWAKAAGLVNGTDWGGIDPRGAAGRGQIAAILVRLYKSILN